MRIKTLQKIAIFTSPITYLYILANIFILPFYFIIRWLNIDDLWFVAFQIKNRSEKELETLEVALEVRQTKQRSKWHKWVDRIALNKVRRIRNG